MAPEDDVRQARSARNATDADARVGFYLKNDIGRSEHLSGASSECFKGPTFVWRRRAVKMQYFSVLFAFSVLLCPAADAQQRSATAPAEQFFPTAVSEQYARDVYLELVRAQSQMVDKKYERHRRNATMEVSFTVGKNGQAQSLKVPRSSGDPELDKIVIDVVKSTRFSAPPAGANADFLLPLSFRLN